MAYVPFTSDIGVTVGDWVAYNNMDWLAGLGQFSLTMWWLNSKTDAATYSIFSKSNNGAANWTLDTVQNSGKQFQWVHGDGTVGIFTNTAVFATSAFRHLAVAFDGSQATDVTKVLLYVDGVVQATTMIGSGFPTTLPASAGRSLFLNIRESGLLGNAGTYYNLKMWDRTLSAAEIARDMVSYHPVRQRACRFWVSDMTTTFAPDRVGSAVPTFNIPGASDGTFSAQTFTHVPATGRYGSGFRGLRTRRDCGAQMHHVPGLIR